MVKILIIILANAMMINFIYANSGAHTCSRKALYKNQEILIDGYTGVNGSGLNKIMKDYPKAMYHLNKYQKLNDIKVFNLVSGSVSTASLLTGLLYSGDKSNKNNFILFGAVVALINFLTTKTIKFYNEKELTLAIDEFNKTSQHSINMIDQGSSDTNKPSIFLNKNWSF